MIGCDDAGDVRNGPVVQDSAGITIVSNDHTQPAWSTPWVLAEQPVLQIGSTEGDAAQLLFQVTDARRLRDGRVLVVNSGSSEVRLFGADGRLVRAFGGRGDGPGEFRSPWHAYPMRGDSVLVIDLYREVAIFDSSGRYARQFSLDLPSGMRGGEAAEPVDQFGDGSLLFRGHTPQDPSWEGVRRNRVHMLAVPLDGSRPRSFGIFEDQTVHYGQPYRDYAFGARAMAAAAESTMWYGPGDSFELREVASDGTLLRLVRLDRPGRPVTEADKEQYRRNYVEQMDKWNPGRGKEFWRQMASDALFPDSFPAHYQIETDPLGNVWVQDYRSLMSPTETDREWSVFDSVGTYLGTVAVHGGLAVYDIGDEHLVGKWTDEMGVEYVRVYRIEKP